MTHIVKERVFATSSEIIGAGRFLGLDDRELVGLFSDYERAASIAERQEIVEKIELDLRAQMQLEEKSSYPLGSRLALHHSLFNYLLSELAEIDPYSEVYHIKVRVLGDHVKSYVKQKGRTGLPEAYVHYNNVMASGTMTSGAMTSGAMTNEKAACAA